jgi:hypothetical protein
VKKKKKKNQMPFFFFFFFPALLSNCCAENLPYNFVHLECHLVSVDDRKKRTVNVVMSIIFRLSVALGWEVAVFMSN